MNPQWATAVIAAIGLASNGMWTVLNLRIENRVLTHIDALKEWADDRFVRKPDLAVSEPNSRISKPLQANS